MRNIRIASTSKPHRPLRINPTAAFDAMNAIRRGWENLKKEDPEKYDRLQREMKAAFDETVNDITKELEKKGGIVHIAPYRMHRGDDWEHSETFQPERFPTDEKRNQPLPVQEKSPAGGNKLFDRVYLVYDPGAPLPEIWDQAAGGEFSQMGTQNHQVFYDVEKNLTYKASKFILNTDDTQQELERHKSRGHIIAGPLSHEEYDKLVQFEGWFGPVREREMHNLLSFRFNTEEARKIEQAYQKHRLLADTRKELLAATTEAAPRGIAFSAVTPGAPAKTRTRRLI